MSPADSTYSRELELAGRLAREAGELVLGYRGGELGVELKKGDEPVTIADHAASDQIVAGLEAAFPDDIVISEENADDPRRRDGGRVWFVDPIDGTRDFISGADGFCVMIGLALNSRPVVGAIFHPPSRELLVGAIGAGAWLLPTEGDPIKLAVSTNASLAAARVVTSNKNQRQTRAGDEPVLAISRRNRIGAIGLKLAIIAAGDRDLFFNPSSRASVWDTCAPEIILTEAGGKLTTLRGAPLTYDGEKTRHTRGLIGSNGLIHDAASRRAGPLLG